MFSFPRPHRLLHAYHSHNSSTASCSAPPWIIHSAMLISSTSHPLPHAQHPHESFYVSCYSMQITHPQLYIQHPCDSYPTQCSAPPYPYLIFGTNMTQPILHPQQKHESSPTQCWATHDSQAVPDTVGSRQCVPFLCWPDSVAWHWWHCAGHGYLVVDWKWLLVAQGDIIIIWENRKIKTDNDASMLSILTERVSWYDRWRWIFLQAGQFHKDAPSPQQYHCLRF